MSSSPSTTFATTRQIYFRCKFCRYTGDSYMRIQSHQNKNKDCKKLKIAFFETNPDKEFEVGVEKCYDESDVTITETQEESINVEENEVLFPENLTSGANSSDQLLYSILRQGNRNMGISQVNSPKCIFFC
jgi:hypothetical protein